MFRTAIGHSRAVGRRRRPMPRLEDAAQLNSTGLKFSVQLSSIEMRRVGRHVIGLTAMLSAQVAAVESQLNVSVPSVADS
jgi:hypothetical protein